MCRLPGKEHRTAGVGGTAVAPELAVVANMAVAVEWVGPVAGVVVLAEGWGAFDGVALERAVEEYTGGR